MGFDGLPHGLPVFLSELKSNNSREWFEANKAAFQTVCVAPMLELIEALAPVAGSLVPPHKAEARVNGSLRRIHRDTRFSRDKSPYHDHLHLIFWTGSHPNRSAGIHFVFSGEGVGMGAGHWAFDEVQLNRWRKAVTDYKAMGALEKLIEDAATIGCGTEEPVLKKLPAGHAATGLAGEMLRQKGLVVRTGEHEPWPDALFGRTAIDWIASRMAILAGIDDWLGKHVYRG
ncbi:MAG: DUF2461 domain-containing protein [Rhizobiaceae bacterium]